jgi:BlaI family transcriptional regulator, penicillinase repressor
MKRQRLSPLELSIMEVLWANGPSAVRDVLERLPAKKRPAYTTVQTIFTRLEAKQAVRRTKKIGNAYVFEALIDRTAAHGRVFDEVLKAFGGRGAPLMAFLVESGKVTLEEIDNARALLTSRRKKE